MSSPDINYPAQPSYGEGMADAMKAQMEQLLGQGEYAQMYADAGFEGGNLGDIIAGVEAPIRKQTAQVDTDVLRQTLLGSEKKFQVEKDSETGKYGITGAEVVKDEDGKPQTAGDGRYQMVLINNGSTGAKTYGGGGFSGGGWSKYAPVAPTYALVDTETGGITKFGGDEFDLSVSGRLSDITEASDWIEEQRTAIIKEVGTAIKTAQGAIDDAGGDTDVVAKEFQFENPYTGEALEEGQTVTIREGDGMIDLLGDRRNVQDYQQAPDYASYVKNDKGLNDQFAAARLSGDPRTIEEFGRDHYETFGRDEGRELPMGEFSAVDTGRQAGFDEEGNFLGLAALAEDIQRGNLSRQREADLLDVERLSDRFQDVMADYKPETAAALTDAGDILKGQKDTLTGAGAITVPTDSTYGGDMTASTMQAAQVADPLQLSANTQFGGDLATGQTATGEDTLRSALLGDARTALGQGLTEREQANIYNAARARDTLMGRTFDQSGAIAEAEALVAEDNNRRNQNRSFAQSVLGQEAGIQQGDITRGMAQESEQAGLQQRADLAQAQMDQQANAFDADAAMRASQVNQAQRQQANQFGVGATMDAQRLNEQLKQSGTLGYIDAATRLAALEDQQTLDPFAAILGRAGGNSLQAGQGVFGQAGYGLQSGPQYLNPEAGLGYISQMATNDANMYAANVAANANRTAGIFGGLGSLVGSGIGAYGALS